MNIDTLEITKNSSANYPEARLKSLAAAIPACFYPI
jgi:hypothetical protein